MIQKGSLHQIFLNGQDGKPSLPKLHSTVFTAPSANLIGDIEIGEHSSIWFNTVLRGDVMPIRIGKRTNIQDGSVIHGTFKKAAATIGDDVSVGHSVILHGCTIKNLCLIGMGTTIMDGVVIDDECFVGAGSLVTEGKTFPKKSLIMGRPAKVVRPLEPDELAFLRKSAQNYMDYQKWYVGIKTFTHENIKGGE